jgi:hypothetical protein
MSLIDNLVGEWRMTIADVAGTNKGAGIIGRQIIKEGDEHPFYDFSIQEKLSLGGIRFENISFKRVCDNLDYEATFCYGYMLIGTHSKGKGNWQAIKLPYTSPSCDLASADISSTATAAENSLPVAEVIK